MTMWHYTHLGGIIQRGPGLVLTEATAIAPEGLSIFSILQRASLLLSLSIPNRSYHARGLRSLEGFASGRLDKDCGVCTFPGREDRGTTRSCRTEG